MFILNPDPFLLPAYRMSPFKTDFISFNSQLSDDDFAIKYLDKKFGTGKWHYTYNGREGIELALQEYKLDKDDLVTILTTSDNFYVSSCVTKTIEKFCNWNRELLPETKIIFVNHEFGYPYAEMEKLVALGLPIIEDCCTTFYSQDDNKMIGRYGDFAVFSLPKFFPIQLGGILVNNSNAIPTKKSNLNEVETSYIQKVLSSQLREETVLLQKRTTIFEYAYHLFLPLGFTLRFQNQKEVTPYALVLNNNALLKDLNSLKTFLTNNGIQNSVFYGEDAFFIPIHQNLNHTDLDYFAYLITNFINQ